MTDRRESPLFLILTGYSGAGKDTLFAHILEKNFQRVITANTRFPRPGEQDGVDYHFVTSDVFQQWVREKKLLEYEEFNGTFRGTPKSAVDKPLLYGQNLVARVDVRGAKTLKTYYPDAIILFVAVADLECLRQRMTLRGDNPASIEYRMKLAGEEQKSINDADYVIYNEDGKLKDALAQLETIIEKERTARNATP